MDLRVSRDGVFGGEYHVHSQRPRWRRGRIGNGCIQTTFRTAEDNNSLSLQSGPAAAEGGGIVPMNGQSDGKFHFYRNFRLVVARTEVNDGETENDQDARGARNTIKDVFHKKIIQVI